MKGSNTAQVLARNDSKLYFVDAFMFLDILHRIFVAFNFLI